MMSAKHARACGCDDDRHCRKGVIFGGKVSQRILRNFGVGIGTGPFGAKYCHKENLQEFFCDDTGSKENRVPDGPTR